MSNQITKHVLLGKHCNIAAFASEDQSRYVLNSVHYDAQKGVLEATNGRFLIRVPVEKSAEFPGSETESAESCTIPIKAFKKAMNGAPKKHKKLPVLENVKLTTTPVNGRTRVTLTTTGLKSTAITESFAVDGQYPTTEQVIPTWEPKFKITLQAKYLETICAYAKKHAKGGVEFEFNDSLDPVRIKIPLDEGNRQHALIILMPMKSN